MAEDYRKLARCPSSARGKMERAGNSTECSTEDTQRVAAVARRARDHPLARDHHPSAERIETSDVNEIAFTYFLSRR